MYARSTTVRGRPEAVEDGIRFVRDEVLPTVQQMDGCVGLSMLADRATGRCIVTSAWDSEQALRASEDRLRATRERAQEVFGGPFEVAEWEIGVLHRLRPAGDGAAARVIWGTADPARLDDVLDAARTGLLPKLDDLPGFCSMSMLVDRGTGRMASAATYESRDAMTRARGQGSALRDEFSRAMGATITEVAEFDLVLAHLRVPETV